MKISAQLKQTRDAVAEWARGNSGTAQIARDPVNLVGLLRQSPGAMRACVMFHSEDKRGAYEETGMVDRTFWVVISRGQGLRMDTADNLVESSSGGGKPLFDLLEEAREVVRRISFDPESTEGTPDVKGITPFVLEGYLLDAYQVTFSIGTQLPAVDLEEHAAVLEGEEAA